MTGTETTMGGITRTTEKGTETTETIVTTVTIEQMDTEGDTTIGEATTRGTTTEATTRQEGTTVVVVGPGGEHPTTITTTTEAPTSVAMTVMTVMTVVDSEGEATRRTGCPEAGAPTTTGHTTTDIRMIDHAAAETTDLAVGPDPDPTLKDPVIDAEAPAPIPDPVPDRPTLTGAGLVVAAPQTVGGPTALSSVRIGGRPRRSNQWRSNPLLKGQRSLLRRPSQFRASKVF